MSDPTGVPTVTAPRTAESIAAIVKAYDVRGLVGEQIDAAFVADVGRSFAALMRGEGARTVVVGHDMRASSPELAQAFAEGVCDQGLDVVLIGLASTDQLYFASGKLDVPGAMFTASHNPAAYNGIKLCRPGAKPVGQQTGLATISDELVHGTPAFDGPRGSVSEQDVLDDYATYLHGLVDLSGSRPLTIAVDAGNGMGGHTVPAVLGSNGSFTVRPLFFELDGTFPNHEANPLDPANLVDLQAFVRETGADVGLAFDGDADRCFVVDERGEPVSPSAVTGLVAERELAKHPGSSIIHNLITSRAVPELVSERGGTPVRTRVGHSFIKQQMAETGAVFGGEHSAHYYFRDFWGADSGCSPRCTCSRRSGERRPRLGAARRVRALCRVGRDQLDRRRRRRGHRVGHRGLRRPDSVDRPPRRRHRRPHRRCVVQPPRVEHRTAAAPERRGRDVRACRRDRGRRSSASSASDLDTQAMMLTGAPDLDDVRQLQDADVDGGCVPGHSPARRCGAVSAALEEGVLEPLARVRPRAVIVVVGRGTARDAADLVVATMSAHTDVPLVVVPTIPGWVGPLDVVIVSGDDAGDRALADAAARAVRRHAELVLDVPVEGPIAEAAAGAGMDLSPRVSHT